MPEQRAMKKYVVQSTSNGVEVLVSHSEHPDDAARLDTSSYTGGLEWGYEGAGPRSLAHLLLSHCLSDTYSDIFMREVIANKSPIQKREQVVVFTEEELLIWLRNELNKGIDRRLNRRSTNE
jgi:hypothetical protein